MLDVVLIIVCVWNVMLIIDFAQNVLVGMELEQDHAKAVIMIIAITAVSGVIICVHLALLDLLCLIMIHVWDVLILIVHNVKRDLHLIVQSALMDTV